MKIFYEKVKPIFDDFNIRYNILITKYANHATDYIRNHSNLSESYSCVASVSGDGLLFEVVNSFANCLDSGEAQKLPIPLSILFDLYIWSTVNNSYCFRCHSCWIRQWVGSFAQLHLL